MNQLTAECPDFTATLKVSSVGVTTVTVTKKRAQGGSAPLPPIKRERMSSYDKFDEARLKQRQLEDTYTFTAASEAQARQELQNRTKHRIVWKGADTRVHVGDVAKFRDKGLSVEEARRQMVQAGQAPKGVAAEKAKNIAIGATPPKPAEQSGGIVLSPEEKYELAQKRANQFMAKHREFVSSGFNWERMLRYAMDAGFIPDAKSPATVEQWEAAYEFLLQHSMIQMVEGQITPVQPYRFLSEERPSTPSGSAQKRGLDEARRDLRNVSTDELQRMEEERQKQARARRAGVQPEVKPAPEVSVVDAKTMPMDELRGVVTRQRGAV